MPSSGLPYVSSMAFRLMFRSGKRLTTAVRAEDNFFAKKNVPALHEPVVVEQADIYLMSYLTRQSLISSVRVFENPINDCWSL
jgi:hypothetical protein